MTGLNKNMRPRETDDCKSPQSPVYGRRRAVSFDAGQLRNPCEKNRAYGTGNTRIDLQTLELKVNWQGDQKKRTARRIGNYQLQSRLGVGTSGQVFLAKHVVTDETVAIKIIPKNNNNTVRRAMKEARVMQALGSHPGIIALREVIENEDRICLVMQYVENKDLFDYIKTKGRLSTEESWRLFHQLVDAVSYAHSKGIIHRDIKPENIFMDKNNNVVLGDWGFACTWSSFIRRTRSCGSLNYAAPEIFRRRAYVGPELDVFSLGAVLYNMLTGGMPFGPSDVMETVNRTVKGKWLVASFLSNPNVAFFHSVFEPEPLKRATMYDVALYNKKQNKMVREAARKRNKPSLGSTLYNMLGFGTSDNVKAPESHKAVAFSSESKEPEIRHAETGKKVVVVRRNSRCAV